MREKIKLMIADDQELIRDSLRIVLSANHSIKELVGGILGYKIIGYAWYVEMFIGLYLCVPFLNIVVEKVFNSGNKKLIYGLFVILIFFQC